MDLLLESELAPFHVATLGNQAFRCGATFGNRQSIAVSHDGRALYFATYPRVAELSTDDGKVHRSLGGSCLFDYVTMASDGAVVAFEREAVRWFDAKSGDQLASVKTRAAAMARVAASPTDPRRAAIGAYYGQWSLVIVDALSEPSVVSAEVPDVARVGLIRSLAFSADGAELFACCTRAVLRYDARTGALKGILFEPSSVRHQGWTTGSYMAGFIVLDATSALALVEGATLVRLDLATGEVRASTAMDRGRYNLLASPSPSGRVIVGTTEKSLVIDASTLSIERAVTGQFALDGDGGDLLVEARSERCWIVDTKGAIHALDLATGALRAAEQCSFPSFVAWRSDDELVVGRMSGPIEIIDVTRGESRFVSVPRGNSQRAYSASRDAVLVSAEDGSPGSWKWLSLIDQSLAPLEGGERGSPLVANNRVWHVDYKKKRLVCGSRSIELGPMKQVKVLVASPDERRAFASLGSEALYIDLEEGAVLARYKLLGAEWAQFVSETELVITGSKGAIWIDPATGAPLDRAPRARSHRAAVSADGTIVAVLEGVWSVSLVWRDQPESLVNFSGATHPQCAAFRKRSDGSTRLVVAGAESVVRVYDVDRALATRPVVKAKKAKRAAG